MHIMFCYTVLISFSYSKLTSDVTINSFSHTQWQSSLTAMLSQFWFAIDSFVFWGRVTVGWGGGGGGVWPHNELTAVCPDDARSIMSSRYCTIPLS